MNKDTHPLIAIVTVLLGGMLMAGGHYGAIGRALDDAEALMAEAEKRYSLSARLRELDQ